MKNAIFNTLAEQVESNAGTWTDKSECFISKFDNIVPAAKLQADMAITSLGETSSDVFEFADMEILDANLATLPRGPQNAVEIAPQTRLRVRYLRFTLTVNPQAIIPGAMDFDPASFPNATLTTVCVRALMLNGTLAPGLTKHLLENTPKLVLLFYIQAHTEFDISIKTRCDVGPDQDKYEKWIHEVKCKTKFYAAKHCIQVSHVGRLEGTQTLVQRLTSLKQQTFDPVTKQTKCLSIEELHQRHQFLLIEIKSDTPPADVPQLDQLLIQAVSEDLRKRLLSRVIPLPTTSNSANVQRFTNMMQHAIEAENDLKTITNIAEKAAHRQTRPCNIRQNTNSQRGPQTFFAGGHEQHTEHPDDQSVHASNPYCATPNCEAISHSTGTVIVPMCFLTKCTPSISAEQQEPMAQAIIAMGTAVESMQDDMPFTRASIAEAALQTASGARMPIKCFGCDGLLKHTENAFHLWRNCPNKADKEVWDNFQRNLKEFRKSKQTRQDLRRNQGGRESQHGRNPMNQGGGEPQYGRSMATDPKNWKGHGCPSKKIQEQVLAIADNKNTPRTRVTLLASLKASLEACDLETEEKKQPAKKARWNGKGMTFLMFMKPDTQALNQAKETNGGPRTMLGSPPREKYKFKIAFKLPFIHFPVGDGQTLKDTATLSGPLDTGGCCNMGNLACHKETYEQHPQWKESEMLSVASRLIWTLGIGK
jgi:hypothetical protein